jgi:D-alanine-D-alanine ligase
MWEAARLHLNSPWINQMPSHTFSAAGIAIAPSVTVTEFEWKKNPEAVKESIEPLGLPLFVKASHGGSSRGTVKVKALTSLASAMEEALSLILKC